jgi:hypothetical protein
MARLRVRVDPYLLLLLVLSLGALFPLAMPGYFFDAHDGRHSVFFASMFDESIRSGAVWPRWAMHHNQGYGYPTFVVQAPLAFYVAEFFMLLGLGVTTAVKCAWAVGVLSGAWGMYALVRAWLAGDALPTRLAALCAVAAGLLFTFAPYHLLDMYVRAALAETLSLAWFPWVFLAFDRLIVRGVTRGWQGRLALAALSLAGLLMTHVFALIAFTPLLVGFVLFRLWMVWRQAPDRRLAAAPLVRRTLLAGGAGLAALLLAAIFLAPLLGEGGLLAQEVFTDETYAYARHWVYWGQFVSPFWGFGFSDDPAGANDGMGFQLGVMPALLALVGLVLLLRPYPAEESPADGAIHWLCWFFLGISVAILFLITPAAAPIWRAIPLIEVIQFPWRLLALTTFTLSALGGLVVWQLARAEWSGVASAAPAGDGVLVVGLLVCLAGFAYARPSGLQPVEPWREDGRAVMQFEQEHPDMLGYTRFVEERFTTSPLTEQYLAADFANEKLERLAILAGSGTVVRAYSLGHAFGGEVVMDSPGVVQVRVFQFPGWQVKLDGEPVAFRLSPPHGLIELDVPVGRHQIDVWMGSTPLRSAGLIVSGITLLGLFGLVILGRIASKST